MMPRRSTIILLSLLLALGFVTDTSAQTGSRTNPPQLIGWGGIRLDEAAVGSGIHVVPTSEPSCCFPGETATNMQLVVERMQNLGYNAVRVDFDPICTDNTDAQYMSQYSTTNMQRAITIAQRYAFWIIIDYHGYVDQALTPGPVSTSSGPSTLIIPGYSTLQACWLGQWAAIVNSFKTSYADMVWEPLNEPNGIDLPTMTGAYQAWINQDRNLGDTHWIVVGNLCSYGCTFSDFSQGYAVVTDPANLVFINLHAYMGYQYLSPWTTAEADLYANQFYQWILAGQQRTGWPNLTTELGADPLCSLTACPNAGWGTCSTPPQTCGGSAGYTAVSYEFVKHLSGLLEAAGMGWIGWTAGSWTDTPGGPVLGALDPTNWGTSLGTVSIPTVKPPVTTVGQSFFSLLLSNPFALISILGVVGIVGVAVGGGRRRGSRNR